MSKIFLNDTSAGDTTKQNVSLHLKNIFEDGELPEDSVVKKSLTAASEGKQYKTKLYNLDVIHDKLEAYIQAMPEADYERFLGEKSINITTLTKGDKYHD